MDHRPQENLGYVPERLVLDRRASSLPLELIDLIPGDTEQLSFLRFLRMFRLLRLLKLLKLDQIIEQIEEQLEMSLWFLRLVIMLIRFASWDTFLDASGT